MLSKPVLDFVLGGFRLLSVAFLRRSQEDFDCAIGPDDHTSDGTSPLAQEL
jgi:hypothetical protein